MVMVNLFGKMEVVIKGNGNKVKCMEQVKFLLQMQKRFQAIGLMANINNKTKIEILNNYWQKRNFFWIKFLFY